MSNKKLDFKTWCNDIGIRECYQKTECDDCKASWSFCEAQEKREIEELKIKFSEATKTYTDEIEELEKESSALKKKLSEAVEVIRFYGNTDNYHQRKENFFDYIQSDVSFEDYLYFGGKRARAFLNGNKDE